jgi:hypothetical protein
MAGWTSVHTVLGELENGIKVVVTDITTDDAAATAVVVKPLKRIISFAPGIKNCGTQAAASYTCAATANVGNSITITPTALADNASLTILSFGV